METIANRIKKAMELREIRQADLADKTKISKGALSSYISGRYAPKQNNIYLIAKALNVNEAWLMGYDVPMERVSDAKYATYSDIDTIAFEITGRSLQYSPRIFDAICKDLDNLLKKGNKTLTCQGQLNLKHILTDSNISYDEKALALRTVIEMILFNPRENSIQLFYTLDRKETETQMQKLISISKKLNQVGLSKVIDYATDLCNMNNYTQGIDELNKHDDTTHADNSCCTIVPSPHFKTVGEARKFLKSRNHLAAWKTDGLSDEDIITMANSILSDGD